MSRLICPPEHRFTQCVVSKIGAVPDPSFTVTTHVRVLVGPTALSSFVEVCAQATSYLTNATEDFVKQALLAPEIFTDLLEMLFRGGDVRTDLDKCTRSRSRRKAAKCCRINGARVLSAIFAAASSLDMVR